MTANGWFQILLLLGVTFAVTKPLGIFMTRVFNGEKTFLDPVLRPIEKLVYRLTGVDKQHEMRWTEYTVAMLLFSGVSMALLYLIQRTQQWLPLNPQKMVNVPPAVGFNTAASFTTNTNWQNYSGESTMSYFTQMAGLAYHNFTSAATGIVLAIVIIRGLARKETDKLGNFWVDMTRCLLWVLLPLCLVGSLVLVSQGVVQNLKPYTTVELTEPQTVQVTGADGKTSNQVVSQQVIAQGPVASQEINKELGTKGGGFFGANSAHPFENPTPFSNFIEMFSIFAIASSLTYTLGRMTGSPRHGWAVWAAMAVLFLMGVTTAYWSEARGNALLGGVDQRASALQPGGNMEGKEVRFGIANSALFATVTSDTSCGAVNSQHDSFTPLGGMVPMINIMLGEVVFGGVGSGLYGVVVFAILAGFIAGLVVGRTPRPLGWGGGGIGGLQDLQSRGGRGLTGPLRLFLDGGQQWLRLRRPERQHDVVQHQRSGSHDAGPLLHAYPRTCRRREPGEEKDRSCICRDVSRDRRTVHSIARFHHSDCECAHIFSGAQSGTDSRALADACRKGFLRPP